MHRVIRHARRATALAAGIGLATPALILSAPGPAASAEITLRTLAAARGLRIGSAVSDSALEKDSGYQDKLKYEFNSVTPENAMKWANLEATRGKATWEKADAIVDFAVQNNQMVRGHTLVWHKSLPTWITDGTLSTAELRDALKQHIQGTMKRYAGRVAVWDVVNEAFNDDGTLRQSLWLQKLGSGYIADAFRWAREADPSAKLYINDYDAEWATPKRDALYKLVHDLRAQGVPIDGVGFQTHTLIKDPIPAALPLTQLQDTLTLFAGLGVDVAVTELDVRVKMPSDADKLAAQAETYRRAAAACVSVSRCVSLSVWGLTDKYSWVDSGVPGWGAADLLDRNLQQKPAYAKVHSVLADRDFAGAVMAVHSGKCLTMPADGTQLIQSPCSNGQDQKFTFQRIATKIYTITSNGKCLTVDGASTAAGTAVVGRACVAGKPEQRFELRLIGEAGAQDYKLVPTHSNKCVAVKGGSTANSALVEQTPCLSAPTPTAQVWRLAGVPRQP
ncbi:endo-1,4-beta-xylanase [Microtetraspora malaysiensis]|uniref:endo-1,4-beta-xylanase n=1 Tax=Microtetraspora malaysiensis TaxID=161358 RepID=UPI003D8A5E49